MRISTVLADRAVRISGGLFSLLLCSRFLPDSQFMMVQQITIIQTFATAMLAFPSPASLLKFGFKNYSLGRDLYINVSFIRILLSIIFCSGIYLYVYMMEERSIYEANTILLGVIPMVITQIVSVEFIHHSLSYESKANWIIISVMIFFLILKSAFIYLSGSIYSKIYTEWLEIIVLCVILGSRYLKGYKLIWSNVKYNINKAIKIGKISSGLYLNGVLLVLISRFDQLAVAVLIGKLVFSKYSLICSIVALFLVPSTLFAERILFQLNDAASSKEGFRGKAINCILSLAGIGTVFYLSYAVSFNLIGEFLFKRDLTNLKIEGLLLGTTIIINSVGMAFGQINTFMNGGFFTMRRSIIGFLVMVVLIFFGSKVLGILGIAIATVLSLLCTNVLFWFFSKKIRMVLFRK